MIRGVVGCGNFVGHRGEIKFVAVVVRRKTKNNNAVVENLSPNRPDTKKEDVSFKHSSTNYCQVLS